MPFISNQELREFQMKALDIIWKGWCIDPECPNNPFYGVEVGTKIRINLPKDYKE